MDPTRWNQICDLFFKALEVDPADRNQFLTDTCGNDDELREEVAKLLDFDSGDSISQFLEPPSP